MVTQPEKELRFTRSGQALFFLILGAVVVAVGVTLLATSIYRERNPELPHPGWALLAFIVASSFFLLAWHLTKHAYLILTPMGVEVFPFFRPAKGMRLILWQEISSAQERGVWLTLHLNEEKTSGMHLSMKPIRRDLRKLLVKAVMGRVSC